MNFVPTERSTILIADALLFYEIKKKDPDSLISPIHLRSA